MRKAIVAAMLALALCGCGNSTYKLPDAENRGRFKCEMGSVYVITDTRTHVQYLGWKYGSGSGVCVLVDADGRPMLADDAS